MEDNPYAKKFTCAQRAEANMAEQLPVLLMSYVYMAPGDHSSSLF